MRSVVLLSHFLTEQDVHMDSEGYRPLCILKSLQRVCLCISALLADSLTELKVSYKCKNNDGCK